MTSDGDRSNAVDADDADAESIDSLLAELLGPDFVANEDTNEDTNEATADVAAEVNEMEIGSEDPTVMFSDLAAATGGASIVDHITSVGEQAEDPPSENEGSTNERTTSDDYDDAGEAPEAEAGGAEIQSPATDAEPSGDVSEVDAALAPDRERQNVTIGSLPSEPDPIKTLARDRSGGTAGQLLKLGLISALGFYVILVAAWGIDLARHQSRVMRGVSLEATSLSGMSTDEVREVLTDKQDAFAATPIDVIVGETTVTSDPVTLGASIDQDEIVADALDVGRTGFFFTRPFAWLSSFFGGTDLPTRFQYDAEATAGAAQSVVAAELTQPKEPEMVLDGNEQLTVEPGNSGTTISPREMVGRLPAVIEAGPPYELELQAVIADPEVDQAALETVAVEINELTVDPVRIQVLDQTADVSPRLLKEWTIVDTAQGADWTIDQERALADLRPLFPELGSEDQKARFTVIVGEPVIVPAAETVVCCDAESIGTLRASLSEPLPTPPDDQDEKQAETDEETPARTIVLKPTVVGFDEGVAELESLGIIEEVSTFTTKHSCCQNRVKNIQRFADLMQGVIIRPGESISLNDHVGRRTIERGFVADGAINLGILEPQVGGGISQYATTFFNASFFAGLEFVEYQSHSLYISRYPRGREATISWRRPDLEVRNNTPYGILVWNEYTSTSITVSFYSTAHLDVEALPLKRSSERQCRVDITPRLITYPDGTEVEDSVFAVYRPGEGLDCNGDSTRPDLDETAQAPATTTTTSAPEPEPDPVPEPTVTVPDD